MALEEDKNVVESTGATESQEHAAETVETKESVAPEEVASTEVRNDDVSKGAGITEVKKVPTELERAQYSFHKQFAKQNKKHAEELAEMKKLVESLKDQIKNPDKYRPKYRDDFNTADEYIDYRSEQKFNKLMEEQRAKEEKAAKKLLFSKRLVPKDPDKPILKVTKVKKKKKTGYPPNNLSFFW